MPLLYSEVKEGLSSLGDNEAMRVLQNLERNASSIRDPTAYVLTAARRGIGQQARRQGQAQGGRGEAAGAAPATRERERNRRSKGQRRRIAPLADAADAASKAGGSEAEGGINDSGADLTRTDDAEASTDGMKVEPFEEDSSSLGDASKPRGRQGSTPSDRDKATKHKAKMEIARRVARRVQWLNSNAGLQSEVGSVVVDNLAALGHKDAMEILKRLEAGAAEIQDPEAFLAGEMRQNHRNIGKNEEEGGHDSSQSEHGRREGRGDRGDRVGRGDRVEGRSRTQRVAGATQPLKTGKQVIKTGLKAKQAKQGSNSSEDGLYFGTLGKVQKRVDWLNENASLAAQLDFGQVGALLAKSGPLSEVMKILKMLEENSSDVRDPTGYVISAARRLGTGGGTGIPSGGRKEKSAELNSERQLRGHVDWLNTEFFATTPIDYAKVSPMLLSLSPILAGTILGHLEENAHQVRDPTGYVIAAARREAGRSHSEELQQTPRAWKSADAPAVPAILPVSSGAKEQERIRRRVVWLNDNIPLVLPLIYERIAPELELAGYHHALELLNDLEEHVGNIRDPNAYIVAAARRLTASGNARNRSPAMRPQLGTDATALPRKPSRNLNTDRNSPEERIRRRLDWLNGNVCPPDKLLDFDRLWPHMLHLSHAQVTEILNLYQDQAPSIDDPTAWIRASARRLPAGPAPALAALPDPSAPSSSRAPGKGSYGKGSSPPWSSRAAPMALTGSVSPSDGGLTFYGGPEDKIRRRIEWLDRSAMRQGLLDSQRLMPFLLEVGQQQALGILKRLEELGAEVRDPTGYVVAAARRLQGNGGRRRARSRSRNRRQ